MERHYDHSEPYVANGNSIFTIILIPIIKSQCKMSPTSHYVGALGFTSQKNSHESVEVIA